MTLREVIIPLAVASAAVETTVRAHTLSPISRDHCQLARDVVSHHGGA